MRHLIVAIALLAPSLALAGPASGSRGNHGGVSSESRDGSAASVTIRLSATVVGTTRLSVQGAKNTTVASGIRGTGFIRLGEVDSEGRRPETGHVIERRDDQGAFYIADVRAETGFSGGVNGQLYVSGSNIDGSDVDFRWVCGDLPDSVYRFASSADAPGTNGLSGDSEACDPRGAHVPVQLVLHVPDGAAHGDVGANYVFTAAAELM